MHSTGFHRVFLSSILVAFLLYCVSAVDEAYQCPYDIHVQKGQIIKAKKSVDNGARFLKHTSVYDARECHQLCCERKYCDLAQMQYKNSSNEFYIMQVEKICYMFHCGVPSRCFFEEHDHYATISYERPDEELSGLDSDDDNEYKKPSVKVNKPSWKSQPRPPQKGKSDEEEDLGSEPHKAPKKNQQPVKDNQESEEHKDLHSSWNTKSESKNVDDHVSWKFNEFEKSRDHVKKTESPVYQEVVKNLETPTEQVRVKTRKPVVVEVMKVTEKSKVQPPTEKDADTELEMKLEELTPTEQQPELKTNPPATFHHWREFVDNNPNFPYTIPVIEESTPKRTHITTQHPTTERITTTKTTVKTEPRKTTVKTKKPKPEPHKGGNTHKAVVPTNPHPRLEVPLQNKNVSDVVVIETQHLKIIENKAVLPLAIFLILAILLLFAVALRLRIVKSKLKRRAFATDDADYLINGMYL